MEKSVRLTAAGVGILALIAVCFVLKTLSSIFIPLVLALFLAIFFVPLLNKMEKHRIPRIVGVLIAVLILLLLILILSLFLLNTVTKFAVEFPKYQEKIQGFYYGLDQRLRYFAGQLGERIGYEIPDTFSLFSVVQNFQWGDLISGGLNSILNRSFSFLSAFTVLLLFLIFVMSERVMIQDRIKLAFLRKDEAGNPTPESLKKSETVGFIVDRISKDTLSYLALKTVISALTGLCVGIALSVIGMDFVPLWVAIAFSFNFIPNIGSIVAVFIISTFGFAQFSPDWGIVAYIFFINIAIEFTIGNWLEPMIQGKKFDLSPVVVFFALLFWSWMWGIVGMFLAVPLTMLIKIVLVNVPVLRPIDVVISGVSEDSEAPKRTERLKEKAAAALQAVREKIKTRKNNGKNGK